MLESKTAKNNYVYILLLIDLKTQTIEDSFGFVAIVSIVK